MKNSSDTIGNRILDLPAFSTVPEPTAPPRTPSFCNIRAYSTFVSLLKVSGNRVQKHLL
jgi:hypothetical protein